MSDADRLAEIEKKLHRLSSEIAALNQSVVELRRLDGRRLEEKVDIILLKMFAPERLILEQNEMLGIVEATGTPEDVEDILSEFLASRGR